MNGAAMPATGFDRTSLHCLAPVPAMLWVRPVRESDAPHLERLYADLSPPARRARFHGGVKALPQGWIERTVRPLTDEAVLVAVALMQHAKVTVGEARFVAGDGDPWAREFALTVADGWQGRGIGQRLLDSIEQLAVEQRVLRLFGDVQRENASMLRLAARQGFVARRHPEDATLVRVLKHLSPPPLMAAPSAIPRPSILEWMQ